MLQPNITVTVNIPGIKALAAVHLRDTPAGQAMYNQWVWRYSAFIRSRFVEQSQGGGEWPPLAASTIYARSRAAIARVYRQFKKGEISAVERDKKLKAAYGSQRRFMKKAYGFSPSRGQGRIQRDTHTAAGVAILRDTGVLLNSLTIGAMGNVNERRGIYQAYGIGGGAVHPGAKGATIGRIAAYHNAGGSIPGRPPQRRILVPPSPQVLAGMKKDASVALRKLIAQT